ncbi:glycine-rich domain-containing protein [Streptomyces zaomyceticus]|uniref:glycine-rich domain-containing protein n=1 Tax=Streptomyces zaomyceticus TaxID=68286 RepID=UPI003791A1C9
MARCGCQGGCSCAIGGAGAINVTGNGSASAPFVVSVDLAELLQAGPGITYDPSTGTISVALSADPGNATTFGSDNGLFTFSGGSGGPIALCDEYFTTNEDGDICLKPGTMGLRDTVIFNTAGSFPFNKADYPWLARVRVRVQAGGGGSAGASAAASQSIWRAGGAGGGYAEALVDVATLAASETVTVGAGGAAGVANNGAGGNGGDSSFGALATALGGPGGPAQMATGTSATTANGTPGPAAGTGDWAIGGGGGEGAIRLSGSAGIGGAGGDSQMCHGGASRATAGVGNVPRGYGGGAGGSISANGAAQAGRAGERGIVIVELYG